MRQVEVSFEDVIASLKMTAGNLLGEIAVLQAQVKSLHALLDKAEARIVELTAPKEKTKK